MGYPNVVAALLSSELVVAHVNDADEMEITPWIAANLSMRQSLWTCNPKIFSEPFKFVPVLVTQPYYTSKPVSPYTKTREVLEKAGASADPSKAKAVWLANCVNQSDETRAKVQTSSDLQKTVQELGATSLAALLVQLQKQAQETRPK